MNEPLQNRPVKGSTTCTSEITVNHPSGIHCPLCVDVFSSLHINCLLEFLLLSVSCVFTSAVNEIFIIELPAT